MAASDVTEAKLEQTDVAGACPHSYLRKGFYRLLELGTESSTKIPTVVPAFLGVVGHNAAVGINYSLGDRSY